MPREKTNDLPEEGSTGEPEPIPEAEELAAPTSNDVGEQTLTNADREAEAEE